MLSILYQKASEIQKLAGGVTQGVTRRFVRCPDSPSGRECLKKGMDVRRGEGKFSSVEDRSQKVGVSFNMHGHSHRMLQI